MVISEFVLARKLFVGRITKELLTLMDLPLLASTSGDILEVFLVKHSLVCNQLGRFSFSSKTFRSEDKNQRSTSPSRQQFLGQVTQVVPQSSGLRTFLRGKYAAVKLYQSRELYMPKDALDIAVNAGDLVGIIQKKDPMGNTKRWFVDNGITQGFLPSHILNPIGEDPHAYDDVAAEPFVRSDEVPLITTPTKPDTKEEGVARKGVAPPPPQYPPQQQPVRKAPPVPPPVPPPPVFSQENVLKNPFNVQTKSLEEPSSSTAPLKTNPGLLPSDQRSNHSYEEIAASELAASEVPSEFSQDLSPIYEEIHGCSRSSVSSGSSSNRSNVSTNGNSSTNSSSGSSEQGRFFYSLYDFEATDTTMISTQRGQVVRVVHSTGGEWCYVEDRHANKGYVPITYLKAYHQPPQLSTAENNRENNTTNNTTTNTITTTAQLEKVNEEES